MSEVEKKVEETAEQPEVKTAVIRDKSLPIITMRKLLDAGCYVGHSNKVWNPKMKKYVFEKKHNYYIIDLNKTIEKIIEAYVSIRQIVKDNNGKVLFVGTNDAIKEEVKNVALRSGSFYVINRWLGGTLTNFKTINKRIAYLNQLNQDFAENKFESLSKKEVLNLDKERIKLEANLGGIKELRKNPNAIFVCDVNKEAIAIKEAKKLGIKVFAIVNTNGNPESVDFPIPCNDVSAKSVKLILDLIGDAIVEGKTNSSSSEDLMVAYSPDEGNEVTMNNVVSAFEKEYNEKRAKKLAELKELREKREAMLRERGIFKDKDGKFVKGAPKKVEAKKEAK